jgi:hypothetical protein
MTLEEDWVRLKKAFIEATKNDNIVFAAYPKELRQVDNRGIDFVIRRLLSSNQYRQKIRLYGAPTGHFGQNPFVDNKGIKWALIRVKIEGVTV